MATNYFRTVRNTALALGVVAGVLARTAFAVQATLGWDPSAAAGVAGYMIHYGTSAHTYPWSVDAGNANSFSVNGLQSGQAYYFAVAAYDAAGRQSALSNETVIGTTTPPPTSDVPAGSVSVTSGGGGGCSVQPAGPADALLPLLLLGACLWRSVRRTRTVRAG